MKGNRERLLTLAHQTAAFTRADKLRSLDYYLRPPKVMAGNSNVINMLDHLAAKGSVVVRRVDRSQLLGRDAGTE